MAAHKLLAESARKNATPEQNAHYSKLLKKLLDCPTVSKPGGGNEEAFKQFRQTVAETFPLLHSKANLLVFGDGCFFYVLEGNNSSKNILLMSHHDVVEPGEGWDSDPFDAVERDGCLFGRGALDTKTPLFGELQAAEELLAEGYDFAGMTLYIGSSHNEETSGDGMVLAAEHFRSSGIRFDVILDEGGAITTGMIPGVKAKSAMVAVHEKGRDVYRLSIRDEARGHSGLNPRKGSPVGQLSAFIARLEKEPIFKSQFAPEVKKLFSCHAPYMGFPLKTVFSNIDLFAPVIKTIMAKIPTASAMLSTGMTVASFFAGNPDRPGARAKSAEAYLNLRCVRKETLAKELQQIRALASQYGVTVERVSTDYCEPSSADSPYFEKLEQLLHKNFPDVIVAPYLLTAGTDARRFSGLCDSILRFAPLDMTKQQFHSIHNKNENVTIQNIGQCVLFYKDFIRMV